LVEISLTGHSDGELHAAATAAFSGIALIHQLMSLQSTGSDLFRLNNAPAGSAVQVNAHTWRVLALAGEIARASDGAFDITVGGAMMARGHVPRLVDKTPDASATYRDIELLPDCRVRFRRRLAVDVGGIAKGYAVDHAVQILRNLGVTAACVNAGGDLRAFGDESVSVQVRDPHDPFIARAHVDLRDRALATSANYADDNAFNAAGVVLDPRSHQAVIQGRSASVRAESCAVADALAKCVLVLGHGSAPLLRRYHADGFLIEKSAAFVIDTHSPSGRPHAARLHDQPASATSSAVSPQRHGATGSGAQLGGAVS
jgi:thiamine biosynthesis lipoprotein